MSLSAEFVSRGRKAQCPPNPAFPNGMAVDLARGATPSCTIEIPYPAPECGVYVVRCSICGYGAVITATGRPDDPRHVRVPCKMSGTPQ